MGRAYGTNKTDSLDGLMSDYHLQVVIIQFRNSIGY